MSNIDEMIATYEQQKKMFMEQLQTLVKQEFKIFFNDYPEIKSIFWTQYTPHFNDGETCEFGVYDFFYSVNDDHDDEGSNAFTKPSQWDYDNRSKYDWYEKNIKEYEDKVKELGSRYDVVASALTRFISTLNNIPKETMKDTFGDHSKIIATKDGFDIDEYDHD